MTTRNQTRRLLQSAKLSAALLLLTAPAALPDPKPDSAMHRACAVDLGLDPSTADYDVCVRSLESTLFDTESRPITNKHPACAEVGLNPNSSAFAQCAANMRATLWNENNIGAR